jgi:hypothetical protein
MGRRARIEIARQIEGRSWDGAAGLLAAALIAAVLALAVSASSALAVSGVPELIAPTASSGHNSPLSLEYKLPERP